MRTKILVILLCSLTMRTDAHFDLLRHRGLLIKNETTLDSAFYGSMSFQTVTLHIPTPKFTPEYRFRNGCVHLNHNIHNLSDTINLALEQTLRTRLKNHIFGSNVEQKPRATATYPTELDYRSLPKSIFQKPKPNEKPQTLSSIYHYTPAQLKIVSIKPSMSNIDNLSTTRLSSYIGFDCSRLMHTIRFTAIEPLKAIALIFRTNDEIKSKIKFDVTLKTKMQSRAATSLCNEGQMYSLNTYYPVKIWTCSWEGVKPVDVQIFVNTENKNICEKLRLSKLLVFPEIPPIRRKRRQAGFVVAGAMAAGGFIYSQISKFFHHDNRDIQAVEKAIKITDIEDELRDREIGNLTKGLAILSHNENQILTSTHNQICAFEDANEEITIADIIRSAATEYIQSIEDTLIGTLIPLQGNLPSSIAKKICSSANPASSQHCENFYDKRDHTQISSVHFLNLKDETEPLLAAMKIKIAIPTFEPYLVSTHKILAVPLPLSVSSDKKNFHFMRYNNLPKYFAYFKTYERRVPLDNCERIKTTFFCPMDKLNELYSSDTICLNSIDLQKTNCELKEITSLSNCFISSNENALMVSHVGDITLQHQSAFSTYSSNILNLNQLGQKIVGSNITVLTGSKPIDVSCTQARFTYRPITSEPIIIEEKPLSLSAKEFPISTFNDNDIKSWETTDAEISHQQSQMQHIVDKAIQEEIELKKIKNQNKISELLKVKSTTFQNWVEFAGIIIMVILFIYLIFKLIMAIKPLGAWLWKTCCCIKRRRRSQNAHSNEPAIELVEREESNSLSRRSTPRRQRNVASTYDIATN